MSRKNWKAIERSAAALFGLERHPANTGGAADFGGTKGDLYVGQVKNRKVLSQGELTRVCAEMAALGDTLPDRPFGVVVSKWSNSRPTPHIVSMTEEVWERLRTLLLATEEAHRALAGTTDFRPAGEDANSSSLRRRISALGISRPKKGKDNAKG